MPSSWSTAFAGGADPGGCSCRGGRPHHVRHVDHDGAHGGEFGGVLDLAGAHPSSLFAPSEKTLLIVGSKGVRRSEDGGISFKSVGKPKFRKLKFAKVDKAGADAAKKVAFKVSFSSYPDDTSQLCDLILPDHHPLESWGDHRGWTGVSSLLQPAMRPVFDTKRV